MFNRTFAAALAAVVLSTVPTFAADVTVAGDETTAVAVETVAPATAITAAVPAWKPVSRPSILPALYGGSALLQAYDAYSTLKALKLGAVEANPIVQGVVGNPALFIGVKAAVSAASILAAEQMWKNHHRVAAIVTMAASNGIMAMVAAHNSGVINSLQRR